jgi:transposase
MRVVQEVRRPGYNAGGLSTAAKTVTRLVRTSPPLSVVPVSCDVSSGGVVAHGYDDPVEQRTDVTSDRAWAVPIWILEDCLMAKRQAQVKSEPALPVLQPDAAGLDIGSAEIWVCVPADRDAAAVRRFATYTPDLHQLADWLVACRITSVAMEATGVYWLPVFEILEARGLQVYLVNPHQLKHVPGRKSDIQDCQWIQRLHSYGLLNNSFQPEADMRALRSYLRQRSTLLKHRAAHIQHMQKALLQMNVQLTQAVDDITGQTGLLIIRAIVAGERDPQQLATHRQRNCAKSVADIAKALTGNYRAEHVFALKQALALYDTYTLQVQECDGEIERQLQGLTPQTDDALPPPSQRDKQHSHSKNAPSYDARGLLYKATGVDLCAIKGLGETTVQQILFEIGGSVAAFPTVKQFCSWLTLAPRHEISGGKILRKHVRKTGNRAGQAFRMAAQTLARSQDSALGNYYRRMRARHGPEHAIVATAHKLARIFYHMLKHRVPFDAGSTEAEEQRVRQRKLKYLEREAAKYGMTMTASTPAPGPA